MIAQKVISDELLVKKLKEGDKEAFEAIYNKYYLTAYKIFMNNFFNIQMAEDATHDIFVRLREKIKTFDGIRCFKAWFLVVVKRYACDILRVRKKNHKSLSLFCGKDNRECFLTNFFYKTDFLNPLEKQELVLKTKEAFLKVPYSHQEILHLYYLEDLSLKQISKKLDIPLGTVKSRISRALEHFKDACKNTEGLLQCL